MITVVGVRAGINPAPTDPPHGGIDGDPAPMNPAPTVDFILSIGIISYSMHPY